MKKPPHRVRLHASKLRQRTPRKKHFADTTTKHLSSKRCFVPEETPRIDARSKIYLYAIGFAKKINYTLSV